MAETRSKADVVEQWLRNLSRGVLLSFFLLGAICLLWGGYTVNPFLGGAGGFLWMTSGILLLLSIR